VRREDVDSLGGNWTEACPLLPLLGVYMNISTVDKFKLEIASRKLPQQEPKNAPIGLKFKSQFLKNILA
jgi:hypothetical protein